MNTVTNSNNQTTVQSTQEGSVKVILDTGVTRKKINYFNCTEYLIMALQPHNPEIKNEEVILTYKTIRKYV